jgi:IS605 OrfB family transposase
LNSIALPGFLCDLTTNHQAILDNLMNQFGKARRCVYALKRKGCPKGEIEQIVQKRTGLNSRYVKDAYFSIQNLPQYGVTFGGVQNQRLREKGKISRTEYHQHRNALLLSRGDKTKTGNLNLRLNLHTMKLRISLGKPRSWVYVSLFIPSKYLKRYHALLDGSKPYMVIIKRRDDKSGYDVRIVIEPPAVPHIKIKRIMALDLNAGHTDFAILNKSSGTLVAVGKFNHHETQHTRKGKRKTRLHQLVNKIGNLAAHYRAEIVVGTLNTGSFRSSCRKATRKIRQLPQHTLRQMLLKLERRGLRVMERSEAYTSKVGAHLSRLIGLDVHKCAAILFALKVINYPLFKELMHNLLTQNALHDGDRSLKSTQRSEGRTLTASIPSGSHVKFWMAMKPLLIESETDSNIRGGGDFPMPGREGLTQFGASLKADFPCLQIKIG